MMSLRQRGESYHADYIKGRLHLLRGALGTRSREVALRISRQLEIALAEGATSALWLDLCNRLPRETYLRFAQHAGVKQVYLATWPELRKEYEADLEKRLSLGLLEYNSVKNYKPVLERFNAFVIERDCSALLLKDLDKQFATEYKYWRIGRIREKKGGRGGAGYTLDMGVLHRAFEFAIERKWVQENPFTCEPNRGGAERGAQTFEGHELRAMRKNAQDERLIFILFRWTGLRESDIATLKWGEVDLNTRMIFKPTKKSKYKKTARIPMDDELFTALKEEYAKRNNPGREENIVLHPRKDCPVNESHLQNRIKKLCKRAGISDTRAHRFRDTFAIQLVVQDYTDTVIATILADSVDVIRKHYFSPANAFGPYARIKAAKGMKLEDLDDTTASQQEL